MLSIIADLYKKTEIQNILNQPSKTKESTPSQKPKETWGNKIKRILRGLSGNVSFGIPGLAEIEVGYDPSNVEPQGIQEKEPSPYEIQRATLTKTTLQEGIELIGELLEEIDGNKNGLKLVVFVDDLDRCTPEKAIEVFESIKVFFEIEGIVFVLGLSNEIVELAINEKYKYLKGHFSGQDYLKKIIQLPFIIPSWQEKHLETFLDTILKGYKHSTYKEIFDKTIPLILQSVENNPREVKRFLNHFIIAYDIYGKDKGIEYKKLMAVQAIRLRWNWFLDMAFTGDLAKNLAIAENTTELDSDSIRRIRLPDEKKENLKEDANAKNSYTKNADEIEQTKILIRKASDPTQKNELKKRLNILKKRQSEIPFDKRPDFRESDFYEGTFGRRILDNEPLRKFLQGEGKIIFEISKNQWKLYQRVEVGEIPIPESEQPTESMATSESSMVFEEKKMLEKEMEEKAFQISKLRGDIEKLFKDGRKDEAEKLEKDLEIARDNYYRLEAKHKVLLHKYERYIRPKS